MPSGLTIKSTGLPLGIRQRGEVYQISVTVKGSRRTATAPTLEEALTIRSALESELTLGIGHQKETVWTIREAIQYTDQHEWHDARSRVKLHALAWEVGEYIGLDAKVYMVTTSKLDAFVTHCRSLGNAPATINRKLSAIGKVLSVAKQRNGGVLAKPHIPKQRESGGRIRVVSVTEEAQLLALCRAWDKLDHADAITVLIDTGLRSGELFHLQAQDVDTKTGHLRIWLNKTDHPRSVPMTPRVKAIMARRLPRVPTERVFSYNNSWLDGLWSRLRHSMKLSADKQFVVYALRHTCASRLIQKDVSLRVVGEWLGHKSPTITMRYAHLSPTNLIDAVKALEVFDADF